MPDTAISTLRRPHDLRLANLMGALSTGLTDAVREAATAVTGLDEAAATALVALVDFLPGGSVRMLSQTIGLTHSGAVRLVDRLVAAGVVVRGPGRDARSRSIALTPAGRRLARRVRIARERRIMTILDQFTDQERVSLTESCERLISTLTRQRLEQRAANITPAGGALCRACDFGACQRAEGACPAARAAATFAKRPEPSTTR